METIEAMRLFCDGNMSVKDIYALLMSMGHSQAACVSAFVELSNEPGSSLRVSKYQKDEWQAEIYLTA